MKYLRTYEAYAQSPCFFRLSKTEIPSGEISPIKNTYMVGDTRFNQILVKNGFPDRTNCIHFMDEKAFAQSQGYKALYGDKEYKVSIDSDSLLGWSFLTPVNDWWYKSNPYINLKERNELVKELDRSGYGSADFDALSDRELENEIKKLPQLGLIGAGNLKDLMSSEMWQKEIAFVWTNDKAKIERIPQKSFL